MLRAVTECDTCPELSNRLDETLLSVNAILKRLQNAVANRDLNRSGALELELERAMAVKDAAFQAWMQHRKSHDAAAA